MSRALFVLVTCLSLLAPAWSQTPERTPRQLIDELDLKLAQSDDSQKDSRAGRAAALELERAASAQIAALSDQQPLHKSLTERDDRGLTPLMQAITGGYAQVVAALLSNESVRAGINEANQAGETPWMLANFQPALTHVACHPQALTVERSVLMPAPLKRLGRILFADERPIDTIRQGLLKAGATGSLDAARAAWMGRCPGTKPELLAELSASEDILNTLIRWTMKEQRQFNVAMAKDQDALPKSPLAGIVFVRPRTGDGAPALMTSLPRAHQVCPSMAYPEMPLLDWAGSITFKVVAEVVNGLVMGADVRVIESSSLLPRAAAQVEPSLRFAVLKALSGYRCQGSQIFEQEFQFKIGK